MEGKVEAKKTTGHRQERVGTVVSAKMQKTVVVAVERLIRHELYRKTLRRTATFMAHDVHGAKQGDRVRIRETRPLSRLKRWEVVEIIERAAMPAQAPAAATGLAERRHAMIQMRTLLQVADNSGARKISCILPHRRLHRAISLGLVTSSPPT